ncbi:PAS domain S-box-containing protein/diguanylate cyclase (GGDEF)-like protein [Nitrosomonas oligotropha]|uniref:PAS domain S-box-containing protein/diguanylate cyclase (GGDEF)-like protein n=1 Tax=Nitrosomonas oligotropha TaxID=42354 RepID=A0A2T5I124_9PROT|nr:PAS domain S-box protein [Nitrosomonas oligotropha]PTQ77530.1 PAS domain S-box-containing protein/diguanylate cyclase (GGDEF)-like protein [Nitrosomonas oligotropha]
MNSDGFVPKDPLDCDAAIPASIVLSEQQLRELFDDTKDLIQSVAPDGRLLFVNRAWREALGYTAGEVATLTIFNIVHPSHHAQCQEFIRRIMAGENAGLIEVPFQTKDGQTMMVEGNVSLYVADGQPVATRGIFRNITGRKAAEAESLALKQNLEHTVIQRTAELQASEKRFRNLVASIPGAVYEFCVDAAGCRSLPFMSEGIENLIGRTSAKCMADVEILFQMIPGHAVPALEKSIQDSMEKLTPWFYEFPVQTPKGMKWLHGYSIPQREADGNTRWHGVLVDATPQKQMETALRENEQLFRSLTEAASVGIFRTDAAGKCLYVNERWCHMTGLDAIAAAGHGWIAAIHPEDRERVIVEWNEAVQWQQPFMSEYRFQTKEQTTAWILGQAQAERDQNGDVRGFVGTITDISDLKMKEAELAESRNLLKTIVDTVPVRIFWKDKQSCYLGCNPIFARDAGMTSPQEIIGKVDYDLSWTKDQADHYRNDDKRVISSGTSMLYYEEALNNAAGEALWIETSKVPLLSTRKEIIGVLGIYQDISKQKQASDSMRLAAAIYQSSNEAIMVMDENNRIIQVNPAFTRMTGYEMADVLGKDPAMFRSNRHDEAFYKEMKRKLLDEGHWQGEIWDLRKDGSIYAKWLNISVIRHLSGDVHYYVSQFSDITEKKKKDEIILFQANYDPLTGLPNRNLFKELLDQEIKKSQRSKSPLSLLLMDLDHFKDINDTLGHDKGDELLREVASRIKSCASKTDTVARLGGDEFAIILSKCGDNKAAAAIAQQITQKLNKPFKLRHNRADHYISTSIGIVFYPQDGADRKSLMKHADQAMYAAKLEGRNRFCYFTPSMQQAAHEKMLLMQDLRQAIVKNELRVYYQPILELSSERIVKAEALLRWNHSKRGMISPTIFIPLAEESGLILEIGEMVFRESIDLIDQWRRRLGYIIQISVNISPIQFKHMNDYRWLDSLIQLGLPGDCINVEITEGLLLKDSAVVQQNLLELHNNGIEVSIDDFGTGFSSLSYLKKFDIDFLKIDYSFVHQLMGNATDRALVEAIIVMAHKLDIKTIAEGVETEAQQDLLTHFGCDYVQGFLYSVPVPQQEFEQLLIDQENRNTA